ncbi:16S rRNA (cytosine(1402)-N(4))-methyltransferase RsmH [Thermodesulfobacteriota bacterium]
MDYPHKPVLLEEVIRNLVTDKNGLYVDGTVGTGGHSIELANVLGEKGSLICLDRDQDAIKLSSERLNFLEQSVKVIKANYRELDRVLSELQIEGVNGVLLDLGMSSLQLERSSRGFSFNRDEPLDMRMDSDEKMTAGYLVNNLSLREIETLLREYGEEKRAKTIARAIVRAREAKPIETSYQLATLIRGVSPPTYKSKGKHPATRAFQALRIAVNNELENLKIFLNKAPSFISEGGRLVVLSYHSLEDRIVKQAMAMWERGCICPHDLPVCVCDKKIVFKRIHKKGISPGITEIKHNPRARSAIMRVAERV